MKITVRYEQHQDDETVVTTEDPEVAQSFLDDLIAMEERGYKLAGSVTVEDGPHSWSAVIDNHRCRDSAACHESHLSWQDLTFRAEVERAEEGDDALPATVAQIRETFGTGEAA